MTSATSYIFTGADGDDVTQLLRQVQQDAFARRQQHSDIWQADYCATLLSGPALKWYFELDETIQYS